MPKHHEKKPHKRGIGLKLVGNPNEFLNILVTDPEYHEWSLDQVNNEGPDHKQVHSALLLKRMYKLVESVENLTGTKFTEQKGSQIISERHEEEVIIPVNLPLASATKEQTEAIVQVLARSPEHELIAFNSLLQGIEWSISALSKKN